VASEQVRADDLEAPLNVLKERDWIENLPASVVSFLDRYQNNFREYSLYFHKSLIVDATKYMKAALADLEKEFPNEPMTINVTHAFDNYNQLLLFMKAERERQVRAMKELIDHFMVIREELLEQIEGVKDIGKNIEVDKSAQLKK